MDIFIIKIEEDIDCLSFKKKDYSNTKKLKAHCFAYFTLDKILKEKYGVNDRTIVFENGKPFLKNKEKQFSISHSGEYVALCFSDNNCGIDIEKIIPRDFEKISKKMGFSSQNLEDFYKHWTKYEASYKLNSQSQKETSYKYNNYILTAVSTNLKEEFKFF
ncbi:MAG: hypothetical protein MJ231_00350 [bacterium]|nr:hypothetical protein [bacterium]